MRGCVIHGLNMFNMVHPGEIMVEILTREERSVPRTAVSHPWLFEFEMFVAPVLHLQSLR